MRIHSQPSYCLTIQYHPLWFWMIDKLCKPDVVMNAYTQSTLLLSNHSMSSTVLLNDVTLFCNKCIYTVHSQPSYCLIHCGFSLIDALCFPAEWYHVVIASTQYTQSYSITSVHRRCHHTHPTKLKVLKWFVNTPICWVFFLNREGNFHL